MVAEAHSRGVFVTGTDTGVGKTLVAAALARFLVNRGLRMGVMKPVETGVEDPATPGPDAILLRWAAKTDFPAELLAPCRLRLPLAPSEAAAAEGVTVDPAKLVAAIRLGIAESDFLIVEGAGGLMVPLAGGFLVADLVKASGLPLLTVCRPGLGTINHTLLTLFCARTMELPMAGFLINGMPAQPGPAEATAPHTLAALASGDLLGVLPQVAGSERDKVEQLADQFKCLPTLPWLLAGLGLQ
jgi:dethiobiotin synthetase